MSQLMLITLTFVKVFSTPVTQEYLILTGSTGIRCFCPGDVWTYECAVEGPGSTVWSGSALDCTSSSNDIVLLHSRFNNNDSFSDVKHCGKASAVGVSVDGDVYISQLNILVNTELLGKKIICTKDTGNETAEVGVETIIATERFDDLLSPGTPQLVHNQKHQLRFAWNSATIINCTPIQYSIVSDCGLCPNTTANNEVTCQLHSSVLKRSCSFAVQKILCNNTLGNKSDVIIIDLLADELSETEKNTSLSVHFAIAVLIVSIIAVVLTIVTVVKNKCSESTTLTGLTTVHRERALVPAYEETTVVSGDTEIGIKLDKNDCYLATNNFEEKNEADLSSVTMKSNITSL